jgi:hypothetical protein
MKEKSQSNTKNKIRDLDIYPGNNPHILAHASSLWAITFADESLISLFEK